MLGLPVKILFSPMVLPLVLFAGGGIAFKLSTPKCDPIPDNADMFVLTGDPRRIPFAMEKLNGYPNRRLYIIGAGTPAVDTKFGGQIKIESESKTTSENAVAIKKIVHENMMRQIVVITTDDHTNRAIYLVKRHIPYVKVNACPVPLSNMPAAKRLERWAYEYVKFIGTVLGIEQRG